MPGRHDNQLAVHVAEDSPISTERSLSRDDLASALSDSLFPTFVTDPEGRVLFWNRGMETMLDVSSATAKGHEYHIYFADIPDLLLETAAADVYTGEIEIKRRRQSRHYLLTAHRVHLPEFGSACLVHLHDLSRRKQHEERQLHQQRMESLGRLAGGIAHDFNNILTIIRGNAVALRNSDEMQAEFREMATSIVKATQKGGAMINRLLTFSKPQPYTPFPIVVETLIEETLALVSRADWERVELDTVLELDLPQIKGEPNRLSQVLVNLVVNAHDAMPEGGTLTVAAKRESYLTPSELPDGDVRPGNYVAISITDTGGGMDDDVKGRIFEPFFTTKGSGKGTGLGLPNVHLIVRQHGGWLDVDSTPGKGSTFTVHLPVADDQ
ncbi:MAG: Wide host range VirA protein [Calditrichaeota bacterium]|nr:Wide host range VirA protein [Calditrichota bacterium]